MSEQGPQPREIDWAKIIETALTAPGNVGNVYNRFYSYSFLNQMYLRMQGVAEPVATYKRWQAIGRQVMKGARAKEIIKPIIVNQPNEEGEPEPVVVGFKPVRCIFAYSDTVGPDFPPVALPEWDVDAALAKLNITKVPFRKNDANIQGYARGRDIAVNPFAVHPGKTLMHELGHVVLGHTLPETIAEYETHRGIMEFQAEATAHLTMNELGQLTDEMATHSRGYIQDWLEGERPPDKAIRQVFAATDQILKAGRIAVSEMINGVSNE